MLSKRPLLLSRTSGAGFKSSPPHREPTKLVPVIPRGWRSISAAGSHLLSPQALPHPEPAGSWLCAKATVSPPPPPPLPPYPAWVPACSLLGQGRAGAGSGAGCVAWGFGTDCGLGVRPAWPARRTGLLLPVPRFSGETVLPGRHQDMFASSVSSARSSLPDPLLLPLCLLLLSTFTASCSACPFSVGVPRTLPPFFTLSTPIFLSV